MTIASDHLSKSTQARKMSFAFLTRRYFLWTGCKNLCLKKKSLLPVLCTRSHSCTRDSLDSRNTRAISPVTTLFTKLFLSDVVFFLLFALFAGTHWELGYKDLVSLSLSLSLSFFLSPNSGGLCIYKGSGRRSYRVVSWIFTAGALLDEDCFDERNKERREMLAPRRVRIRDFDVSPYSALPRANSRKSTCFECSVFRPFANFLEQFSHTESSRVSFCYFVALLIALLHYFFNSLLMSLRFRIFGYI